MEKMHWTAEEIKKKKMCDLDQTIKNTIDSLNINVNSSDGDLSSSDSEF